MTTYEANDVLPTYEADDVLRQYVAILQSGGHGVIRDASELPCPKEAIRFVLQHVFKVGKEDKQLLEWLKNAYVALADFQYLTEKERKALAVMETLSSPTDLADPELRAAWTGLLARYRAELDDISKELGSPIVFR